MNTRAIRVALVKHGRRYIKRVRKIRSRTRNGIAGIVVILVVTYTLFLLPPVGFPSGSYVSITKGETAGQVARTLADKHVIAWPELFRVLVRVTGGSDGVKAGLYRFNAPLGLAAVTRRLLTGDLGIAPERVTLVEGTTVRDMGKTLAQKFPTITATGFLKAGAQYEGYLFPDTYSFMPDVSSQTVIDTMRKNFDTRIASITPEISASGHSLKDIVIMASLVAREGRTLTEKRMIAGILWNRIRVGMPLQVDAVFGYIFGKPTFSPSYADLTVKSPYNTYTHKGLPPGPIDNPGLDSILAAATPTKSKYLYYITGKDGKMHYAETLAQHNRNVARYLQK